MQQMQLSMGRTLKMPENVSKLQNPKMGRPHPSTKNLNGQKLGRLTIIGYAGVIQNKSPKDCMSYWLAKCECGNYLITGAQGLNAGTTLSCGCYNLDRTIETHTKHGKSHDPEYRIYADAKTRCQNANNKAAYNYHDRGIQFRFNSYVEFIQEVGSRPTPKHTLERINNDGHYEKGNVRWATRSEQSRNNRRTRFLTIHGITKCVAAWAEDEEVNHVLIRTRLQNKWCHLCSVFNKVGVPCPHRTNVRNSHVLKERI